MSLAGLLNQEVQILRRTQTGDPDEYGTPTWETTTTETVCHVQPLSTEEMAARPSARVRYRGYFPAGTEIGHADRIVLATGQEAEVIGQPLRWYNPRRQVESHLVVDLADVIDDDEGGS